MKQLGDLVLPESTQWHDQYQWSPVVQEMVTTLAGIPVLFAVPRRDRPITLLFAPEETWLAESAVLELADMAAQIGNTYPLIWEPTSGPPFRATVVFRHHEPPALALTPLPGAGWPAPRLYAGTVKLQQA